MSHPPETGVQDPDIQLRKKVGKTMKLQRPLTRAALTLTAVIASALAVAGPVVANPRDPLDEDGTAHAASYAFTTIDAPGATGTAVNANSPHAIAGEFDDASGNTHGFVLNRGVFTQIDVPHAVLTTVNGINANGRLAGSYVDANNVSHAFFWCNGVVTTLDPPGSIRSISGFLNARDEVVGTYRTASQIRHGFVWRKGVFTTFDEPNSDPPLGTVAIGINDRGQIVGDYVDRTGDRHGFLLRKGVYTTLDMPGAAHFTVAEGINDAGQIVGLYNNAPVADLPPANQHGFVLRNGIYTTIDVDVPGSTSTTIFSLNARGEIVGSYQDAQGVIHGYVGKPVR